MQMSSQEWNNVTRSNETSTDSPHTVSEGLALNLIGHTHKSSTAVECVGGRVQILGFPDNSLHFSEALAGNHGNIRIN